ncbi:MAG: cytochrome c, class [Cypionkella sp.]|uniref:c-type cytochrome n=1 Tax=Cypionkella sp. TaxID=2811411 RepID=UPI0026140898|nr:cytochrome c [Cypionkella sp.]MDB5660858.1 cytochrome c, class [Cypionkella sp.]
MKKRLIAFTTMAALTAFGVYAQDAEDPFADAVETRHGLMLQMASDLGTLGGMAKGEVAYDKAAATKAAANVAAIASVISMAQFPAGSENGKSADSYALADIWAKPDDFMAKITDLNNAAAMMQTAAATDANAIKASMAQLGGACSACHKAYRQPES